MGNRPKSVYNGFDGAEMRVALDATPLSLTTGGIPRYTRELCRALGETFPEDEYWLVSDQEFSAGTDLPGNVHTRKPRAGRLSRRWWSFGLATEIRTLQADLFHGTDFSVPYFPIVPSVLTLHDLSPWKQINGSRPGGRVRRRTPYLLGLNLATMVLTPSESVRREAIERFRLHPGRVVAVPLAAASRFRPMRPAAPSTPYFLYVGAIAPRKNIPLLVEAWREVRKSFPVDLVLAGKQGDDAPALPVEEGLRILGETPEEDLPDLYSGAVAVLYPSLYEGFGLPVVEAMRCGSAVFTSPDPAITEVTAGAAVQLNPSDARAWTGAMRAALEQPAWLSECRERALRRSAAFSWRQTARLTREVYKEAGKRFGS